MVLPEILHFDEFQDNVPAPDLDFQRFTQEFERLGATRAGRWVTPPAPSMEGFMPTPRVIFRVIK